MPPALYPESGSPLTHWVLKWGEPSRPLPRSAQTLPPNIDIVGFIQTGSVPVAWQLLALGHGQVMGLVVGSLHQEADETEATDPGDGLGVVR